MTYFSEWPIFEITHFPKWSISEANYLLKWPYFKWTFREAFREVIF